MTVHVPFATPHDYASIDMLRRSLLRGFDAREGQDVEFTVKGVPINDVGNPHGHVARPAAFHRPRGRRSPRRAAGAVPRAQGDFAVADLKSPADGVTS